MRLRCRNNGPRDPRPLVRILEIPCQRIRPPAGEFRDHPVAIPLAQFIGEPFGMSISPELNLAIRLHDTAHRPEGAQQPVILRDPLMGSCLLIFTQN
jgi:hypothetical protein